MWYTTSGYNISMSFVLYVYTESSDQHILIWLCDLNEAWPIITSLDYIFTIQIWLCQNQSLPIQTVHWNDRLHIQLYIINYEYQPNWVFLECNCSLISLMAMKWHTKLEIVEKRCPIVFKVIHQIARSHGTKINDFYWNWAFPNCYSSLNSPMAFEMFHKA